jgi:hypothetical protein
MRNSLSLKGKTTAKTQYSIKNLLLSFSITLLVVAVILMTNTFGNNKESYANIRPENTYKIKDYIKESSSTAKLEKAKIKK